MSKTLGQKMGKENTENGVPIECEYCHYVWIYTGNMQMATCPSCSNKNDVSENRTDKSNE